MGVITNNLRFSAPQKPLENKHRCQLLSTARAVFCPRITCEEVLMTTVCRVLYRRQPEYPGVLLPTIHHHVLSRTPTCRQVSLTTGRRCSSCPRNFLNVERKHDRCCLLPTRGNIFLAQRRGSRPARVAFHSCFIDGLRFHEQFQATPRIPLIVRRCNLCPLCLIATAGPRDPSDRPGQEQAGLMH